MHRAVHGLSTLAGMPSSTRGQKRKLLAVAALATGAADYASAAQICELCQLQHSVFTGATADGLLQHAIQALGSQFVCTGRVPFSFPIHGWRWSYLLVTTLPPIWASGIQVTFSSSDSGISASAVSTPINPCLTCMSMRKIGKAMRASLVAKLTGGSSANAQTLNQNVHQVLSMLAAHYTLLISS